MGVTARIITEGGGTIREYSIPDDGWRYDGQVSQEEKNNVLKQLEVRFGKAVFHFQWGARIEIEESKWGFFHNQTGRTIFTPESVDQSRTGIAKYFVKRSQGACFDPDLPDSIGAEDENPFQSPEMHRKRPVFDASAYVLAVVPIPDGSSFLMSRLLENQKIIALDFKNATKMSDTLDRISRFVENNAKSKIDTIIDIRQLIAKTLPCRGDNNICGLGRGHDLKTQDIADFFNRCFETRMPLTSGEKELLSTLEKQGSLVRDQLGKYHVVSAEVVIGMSRSHDLEDRRDTFFHEYSHALFFLDPTFHSKVAGVWSSLNPGEKRFLSGAMIASDYYASGGEELLQTEAQAHGMAPVLSEDGFAKLLYVAQANCVGNKKLAPGCGDFSSYTGNIRVLLDKIHDKYRDVSRCQIPLLDDCETKEKFKFLPVPVDPLESIEIDLFLVDLQVAFDLLHQTKK